MKILLDESVPRRLGAHFPDTFDVHTVSRIGWAGTKNGALIRLAATQRFQALITADQSIEHQQNTLQLPIPVIVVVATSNRLQDMQHFVPNIVAVLSDNMQRIFYRVP